MRARSATNIPMWLNEKRGTAFMQAIIIFLASAGLGGCFTIGDSRLPIPTETVAAPRAAAERTLVVVLGGFGVEAKEMRERGVDRAIQAAWPEADVLLASATYAYYRDGKLVPRLHDEVVAPALRTGYRRVWLAGASMGGMGVLLYEQGHPDTLAGVILFAPYLGSNSLLREIRDAGGARQWEPGALPDEVNRDNYQRQVWKMVKGWAGEPERARRVWLACGVKDHLIDDARLLAGALPGNRFMELQGGHDWGTLLDGIHSLFSRIRSEESKR